MTQLDEVRQLTKEEAIEIYKSEVWKNWDDEAIASFQLAQQLLAVPFDIFHKAVEKVLNRPVSMEELINLEA